MQVEATITRSSRRYWVVCSVLAVLAVLYVLLFPLVQLFLYMGHIDPEGTFGILVQYAYMPLMQAQQSSSVVDSFFNWLGQLYLSMLYPEFAGTGSGR